MSVLLAALPPDLGRAVTRRLLDEGDQVRVILRGGEDPAPYEGAHVATGDAGDDDLVERAAQGARTIVLGEVDGNTRAAALRGAALAGVDRAVLLGKGGGDVPAALSWVALVIPRPLFGLRRGPGPEEFAEAVSAADDLAGEPRTVVDLGTDEGWRTLRLERPR